MKSNIQDLNYQKRLKKYAHVKPQQLCSHSGKKPWGIQTDPTWYLRTSWKHYLELWNLFEPSPRTLTWNLETSWNLCTEPLLGPLETSETLVGWNLHLTPFTWEPRNLTFTWNLEPLLAFTWYPYVEPWNLTLTWNLGTFRNLLLETLDDCPRVPGPSLADTPKLSAGGGK